MASIKVKFRSSSASGSEGVIYYQVIHKRLVRQISTGYTLFPSEWNEENECVKCVYSSSRYNKLKSIQRNLLFDLQLLRQICAYLPSIRTDYTSDDIVSEFHTRQLRSSFFNFLNETISKLQLQGKTRTAETYAAALASFRKFRDNEDIMLQCINSDVMETYQAYLSQQGLALNTISFYMRILRATYNRAVEYGLIEQSYPFKRVYTGIAKTVKRAIPLKVVKVIKQLDLSKSPTLDFARDMFMFSFYTRGMSFIDMAYLRKTDLKNGYLVYRRKKTRQQLIIQWTKEMQMILDKYPENNSDYLLPILKNRGRNERYVYRNVGYNINHNLKKIAQKVGIQIPLTLYVARHSWASAAKAKGIPLGVISEGMGHDSETTTQIYLASLDTSVVDKANSLILKSL